MNESLKTENGKLKIILWVSKNFQLSTFSFQLRNVYTKKHLVHTLRRRSGRTSFLGAGLADPPATREDFAAQGGLWDGLIGMVSLTPPVAYS